jgi:small subunit ribosomal protein S17
MKKTLRGEVVSVKQNHTVVVKVVRKIRHPLYKKLLTVDKKYSVDTGDTTPKLGEIVKIAETKPMSKTKYFVVTEVVKK